MDAIKAPPLASSAAADTGAKDLDIVIFFRKALGSSLDPWRSLLKGYHLFIVIEQEEELQQCKQQLEGLDFDVYSIKEAIRVLDRSNLAGLGKNHAALATARYFALLVSTRRFLAFLDLDAAVPATDPATGELVDPFKQHLGNLRSPSTPFFFNTLYDPFRAGADFVRGYPFSLRMGVPTAISHGLWLGREAPYADLVLTIPKGAFFAMRSINVAFDRELIGPAMLLADSSGGGDLWAGLIAKRICDHLGLGVKSGIPYVAAKEKLEQGQEEEKLPDFEALNFVRGIELPESATSAVDCCAVIAKKIEAEKPRFAADISVEAWIAAWKKAMWAVG